MGCGGSKHDVATGNIATRRSVLQGSSSVGRRNKTSSASQANDDAGMPSKKQVVINDQAISRGAGLASAKDSSEEYLSSRREMSFELAAGGSEGAEYFSVNGDAEVAAGGDEEENGSEGSQEAGPAAVDKMKNATPPETREEEEKRVVIATTREDDGESIGRHSADFKEAISMEDPGADAAKKEKSEKDCDSLIN